MANIEQMCSDLRFAGFRDEAAEMERLAPFEREAERFAAEVNRRRGEMAVARAELTELGVASEIDGITLTMSQRIRLLAQGLEKK